MAIPIHLHQRLSFGLKPEWLTPSGTDPAWSSSESFQGWLWDSLPGYQPLATEYRAKVMVPEDRADQERLAGLDPMMSLVLQWVDSMVDQDNPLREKIALFWHHHLPSTGGREVGQARQLLEIFRDHGLGNFRVLLKAVIKTPAFQRFLDLRGSHKDSPNENFAREFLELHTLGEGNYDLKDVKEAARAFTGFNYRSDPPYRFILDHVSHDPGVKRLLGHQGNIDGDEVVDIVLEQPATARHVATSFLHFFFSDTPSEGMISNCAEKYFQSGYAMRALIEAMLEHPDFKDPRYFHSRVKNPVELIVGLQRQTGMRLIGQKTLRYYFMKTGHTPFNPPTVAGWKGGAHWLRGEKLIYRTFLPSALMAISNRDVPRESLHYKLLSRIQSPSKRKLRYFSDAQWDAERLHSALEKGGEDLSTWLTGKPGLGHEVPDIIEHPLFQYCP